MTMKKLAVALPILATLSFPLAHAAGTTSHSITVGDEAKRTLQEIQTSAVAVEDEADELRMIILRPESNPESSLFRLIFLKDEVNKMGKELSGLEAERQSLADWEQRAVDNTLPLLQATAADTQSAIEYYNANRSHLWMESSDGSADRIYEESKQIATTLRNYLKYDKLRNQEQRLNRDLVAPGGEAGL